MPQDELKTKDELKTTASIHPLRIADGSDGIRHVFIRDLTLDAHVGVHAHEKHTAQRVRINVDLSVSESGPPHQDNLANVVCYASIIGGIRSIVAEGHVHLVETLGERIAAFCLNDERVLTARVRVEKLDIVAEATSVGIEIERGRRKIEKNRP